MELALHRSVEPRRIVYDNEVKKAGLREGWGFSALIENEKILSILFDTSADDPTLLHNMRELDIDPKNRRKVTTVKKEAVQICENIFSTGEIEGIEQSLALKADKGIFVVTGCSHPAMRSILGAPSKFGNPYGIAGGFHGFHDFIAPCTGGR